MYIDPIYFTHKAGNIRSDLYRALCTADFVKYSYTLFVLIFWLNGLCQEMDNIRDIKIICIEVIIYGIGFVLDLLFILSDLHWINYLHH
jgi:hypothetical protein